MKNEERIIELLSEYLRKHDQLEERFAGLDERLAGLDERLAGMEEKVSQMVDRQDVTNRLLTRMAESMNDFVEIHRTQYRGLEQRVSELEKKAAGRE